MRRTPPDLVGGALAGAALGAAAWAVGALGRAPALALLRLDAGGPLALGARKHFVRRMRPCS